MRDREIWKPDHSIPYVIHNLDDEGDFLHGTTIIKPVLMDDDHDPEGRVAFCFLMNRGHMFFGRHLRHNEGELWFLRDEEDHNENYYIGPMTDEELAEYNARFMRGKEPLTREGIVKAFEEELRFG